MHATRTKSIAIYARSASAYGKAQTLERQVQQARALIAHQFGDPNEILVFTDSTTCEINRPGLMALMDAAESGRIERVVATDASRISRSDAEQTAITDRLRNLNIHLTAIDSLLV